MSRIRKSLRCAGLFSAAILGVSGQTAEAQIANPPQRIKPELWLSDAPMWMQENAPKTRVKLHVVVSDRGLVSNCAVTESSGDERLDAVGCLLTSINGRYTPAYDAAGNAVQSGDDLSFVISPHAPFNIGYPAQAMRSSEQGKVVASLEMGVEGRATDCKIKVSSHSDTLDRATCVIFLATHRAIPPQDSFGNYLPFTAEHSMVWKLPK